MGLSPRDQFVTICVGLSVLLLLLSNTDNPQSRVQRIALVVVCMFWLSTILAQFLYNG